MAKHVIKLGVLDVLIMGKYLPLNNLPYSHQKDIVYELTEILGSNLVRQYGGEFSFEILNYNHGCIKGKIKVTWILIAGLAGAVCAYPELKDGAKELWNDTNSVIEFVANGQKCKAKFIDEQFVDGLYGPIKKGETLGEIVNKLECGSYTKEQIMIAIFNQNRNAFINDNINLIKEGEVVVIPRIEDVEKVNEADAKSIIKDHEKTFYNKANSADAKSRAAD